MDFEDERYVRVYTRDTPTWLMWRWEAVALAPNLLRKLDRNGRVEWSPNLPAHRAIAPLVRLPEIVVESGLLDMCDSGTIEIGPGWLEWSRYVPGQNAKSRAKSGAERMAESRQRKKANVDVTNGDNCDECDPVLSPTVLTPAELKQPAHGAGALFPPHSVESPAEAETRSSQAATPPKPRRGKARAAYPPEIEAHFLATLQAACRELTGNQGAGPRRVTAGMQDALRKLWAAESPTEDDITRAIRRRLELSKTGDQYGDLTWEHLCREAQFRKYRDATTGGRRSAPNGRVEPGPRPTETKVVDLRAMAARAKES